MGRWQEAEYELLFRANPPTRALAPTAAQCTVLARQLGRSAGAVLSQWADRRSLVLGHTNSASAGLRDYVVRRGWL